MECVNRSRARVSYPFGDWLSHECTRCVFAQLSDEDLETCELVDRAWKTFSRQIQRQKHPLIERFRLLEGCQSQNDPRARTRTCNRITRLYLIRGNYIRAAQWANVVVAHKKRVDAEEQKADWERDSRYEGSPGLMVTVGLMSVIARALTNLDFFWQVVLPTDTMAYTEEEIATMVENWGEPNYDYCHLCLIESLFVYARCGLYKPSTTFDIALRRKRLKAARDMIHAEVTYNQLLASQALAKLTKFYVEIFRSLIRDGISLLGAPPTAYAIIGLGSVSRGEMCRNSDLEWAILLYRDTEETRAYFRTLAELVELQVVNMGETPPREMSNSDIPRGYSVDSAGLSPCGVPGVYELICSPHLLADYQNNAAYLENPIRAHALCSVSFIDGEPALVEAYRKALDAKLSQWVPADRWFSRRKKLREHRALRFLNGYLREFPPNQDPWQAQTCRVFGIKQELYRPIQMFLDGMGVYHRLSSRSCTARIADLQHMGLISEGTGRSLSQALEKILLLRWRAHSHYETECEYLFPLKTKGSGEPIAPNWPGPVFCMDYDTRRQLEELYRILQPLYRITQKFVSEHENRSQKKLLLRRDADLLARGKREIQEAVRASLRDKKPSARGEALMSIGDKPTALEAFKEALSTDPTNVALLARVAVLEHELRKPEAADRIAALRREGKRIRLMKVCDAQWMLHTMGSLGLIPHLMIDTPVEGSSHVHTTHPLDWPDISQPHGVRGMVYQIVRAELRLPSVYPLIDETTLANDLGLSGERRIRLIQSCLREVRDQEVPPEQIAKVTIVTVGHLVEFAKHGL